jgi:hypothetical protein
MNRTNVNLPYLPYIVKNVKSLCLNELATLSEENVLLTLQTAARPSDPPPALPSAQGMATSVHVVHGTVYTHDDTGGMHGVVGGMNDFMHLLGIQITNIPQEWLF